MTVRDMVESDGASGVTGSGCGPSPGSVSSQAGFPPGSGGRALTDPETPSRPGKLRVIYGPA